MDEKFDSQTKKIYSSNSLKQPFQELLATHATAKESVGVSFSQVYLNR